MVKKKVLIISPVGDLGGRELEVGFIASTISKKHLVNIVSTSNYSKNSQVTSFKGFALTSVNELLFNNNFTIRFFIRLMSFFKKNYIYNSSSLSNTFIKRIFNLELKKVKVLKEEVLKTDLIFICAQLSSNYLEDIILFANKYKKPVIFRTTGHIKKSINFNYLNCVNTYIHHSLINAEKLNIKYPYKIIDQCCFNEEVFLKIPTLERKVNNFMTVSRIHKDKNIDVVINAFCKSKDVNDRLYVVGVGPDLENLIELTKDKRVIFTGFIANNELQKIYNICECFIVSYYELEAGPLTAIEAMAAAKIIISSKTGAMTERLNNKTAFWHNNEESNLIEKINEVKNLSEENINLFSKANRDRYVLGYSKNIIQEKYLNCLNSIFNNK